MKHLPRLGALALAVLLTSACSGNNRPLSYPGSPRPAVVDRNGDGYDDRTGARIDGNKDKDKDKDRDGVRCNAGNGNGNGNGRCRNGNRGRGNGRGDE
jgi:hypothetical protein